MSSSYEFPGILVVYFSVGSSLVSKGEETEDCRNKVTFPGSLSNLVAESAVIAVRAGRESLEIVKSQPSNVTDAETGLKILGDLPKNSSTAH